MLSAPDIKQSLFEIVKKCQFQGPQWVKKALLFSGAWKLQKGAISGPGNLQYLPHSGIWG
jgi:hypothetical protein